MLVKMSELDGKLWVESPYNPILPAEAKKLGGRWSANLKKWVFDVRDKELVQSLYRNIYGTDGTTEVSTVTIRITWAEEQSSRNCNLFAAGRQIARVFGRDSGAKLGDGVVILQGKIFSTGSRNNPALGVKAGTVVQLRDVPVLAAEKAKAEGIALGGTVEIQNEVRQSKGGNE